MNSKAQQTSRLSKAAVAWGLAIGAAAAQIEISRSTIDGGGVVHSASSDGVLELSGTIGQPDAGTMLGGNFELTGGFWFESPPGDCNEDGGVGLFDYADLVACVTGPEGGPSTAPCRCFDADQTGTVDLADFAVIQRSYTGG